ncbi:HelD family protein [Actinoplanes teichomyceticus]|uniref:DNA helicase IV n=1 Tax=Actinoplanes teichomyceticus TaxID=1867 RepID=A0A561VKV8_ACTTI|nr:AAA family ATPase [Actinoplanes teichomyceticus]TWG12259.1 DNA helicase IV [Actinoplanes teichomyceticus]GIF14196.1 DNA helicase [Actinoplanes teichomyceticus]
MSSVSDVARELAAEQAYLARVRAARAWMSDHARIRVATGEQVAGDRYTAETLGRMLKSHAQELAGEPDGAPYFGRLRFDGTGAAGEHRDQQYYIGRRRIAEEQGPPLVIDWRAPVSSLFYRAGAADRHGVAVRRRYGWTHRPPARLTGFEDERLDLGEALGATSRLLAEEIERPRVGPMRDIVATIQPEQDELVRADLDQSLCVQGGPGTGKTAVGLHRAAYLLYAYRRQLRRTGVLVVGPNPAFLRYISAVLPALGEGDVRQRTLDEVLGDRPARAIDTPAAALVKHDARMAEVIRRALGALIREPAEDLVVPDGSYRLRAGAGELARELALARAGDLPYGVGRERFRARIVALLQRRLEQHGESPNRRWLDRTGRSGPVLAVLDACWPKVRPEQLLARLLGEPDTLAAAAEGVLTGAEQAALRWPRPPRSFRSASWSPADLVLLDEIAGAIEHPAGFGHIVVDEAQDLSPMQCRAVARRSRHGSLTVLGDLAQGTTAWAATGWAAQLAHLGKPDAPVTALTAGFRVPAVVLSYANRLLPELRVTVPVTRSVRRDGALRVHRAPDLAAAVTERVRAALSADGSIAVIAADERAGALGAALRAVDDPDSRVTVLPATLVKGLEFDHVVVVEPAEIAAGPRGPHHLYVVLTRAVARMDVLHRAPLPAPLRGGAPPGP